MSTGFKRTSELCEKHHVNYSYQETSYGFRFEFYRNKWGLTITINEQKVLETIKNNNNITVNQIAKVINISPRTVARTISNLKAKGLIKRIGSDKNGSWRIL